jgi:hypothetical protein
LRLQYVLDRLIIRDFFQFSPKDFLVNWAHYSPLLFSPVRETFEAEGVAALQTFGATALRVVVECAYGAGQRGLHSL